MNMYLTSTVIAALSTVGIGIGFAQARVTEYKLVCSKIESILSLRSIQCLSSNVMDATTDVVLRTPGIYLMVDSLVRTFGGRYVLNKVVQHYGRDDRYTASLIAVALKWLIQMRTNRWLRSSSFTQRLGYTLRTIVQPVNITHIL